MTEEAETKGAGSNPDEQVADGRQGEVNGEPERAEYTIDELAAVTGIPSRTIRFYQANGVLPFPRRRGRVALYDDSHIERLKLVADLQTRGLTLRAVRDLLSRPDLDGSSVQQWLGLEKRLQGYRRDASRLVDAEGLEQLTGEQPAGVIARLLRLKLVEHEPDGSVPRFRVNSPRLLQVALKLEAEGVPLEIAADIFDLLHHRLGKSAEEVVRLAAETAASRGRRRAGPSELERVLDALFGSGACGEAVQAIFSREVDRSIAALLKRAVSGARRRRK